MLVKIKTKQQFFDEFGTEWREKLRVKWVSPDMDYLFGKQLNIEQDHACIKDNGWIVTRDALSESSMIMNIDEDGNIC